MAIAAAGGYGYTVAIIAALALGAAAMLMMHALPVDKATYFIEKSKSVLALASSADVDEFCDLERRIYSISNASCSNFHERHHGTSKGHSDAGVMRFRLCVVHCGSLSVN
jgi:hypothetical protein